MHLSPLRMLIVLTLVVSIVIGIDQSVWDGAMTSFVPAGIARGARQLFEQASFSRGFVRAFIAWQDLARQNDALKKENESLISRAAQAELVAEENRELRSALNLQNSSQYTRIDGGIFTARLGPDGYGMLVNRGLKHGVRSGGVLINPQGVLIGKVSRIYDAFSQIQLITDPDFEVAARVLGRNTSGIVRGHGSELSFDFIVAGEDINEGDQIVTSGRDNIPPALIIGTVQHVETSETNVFTGVKILPGVRQAIGAQIIILQEI